MPEHRPPSDEQIRDDVRQRLAADPHLDASMVEVGVRDGVVVLTGSIKSRTVMRYVEDLVRKAPGAATLAKRVAAMRFSLPRRTCL